MATQPMTDDEKTKEVSTDTLAEEPVDDAVVVNEEPEDNHADLVSQVAQKLGRDEYGDEITETPESQAQDTEETPEGDEKPALSKDLQTRAEKAGLSDELAQRLQESGQLEETLAAFDRTLIERFQAPPEEKAETKEPVEEADKEEYPDLDPEVYDEDIIKRDRYHKERIDLLETQLDSLLQDRQDAFENWFDGVLSELGYDVEDVDKCQSTFKAYKGLCEANGISPEKRDRALAERAHAAMFPEDVKKQTQQETVQRLRDAEGKFLPSSKPKGAPPPKQATPEETHSHLVTSVAAYLKKQGVQTY